MSEHLEVSSTGVMEETFIRRTIQTIVLVAFGVLLFVFTLFSAGLILNAASGLEDTFADVILMVEAIFRSPLDSQFGPILVTVSGATTTVLLKSFYNADQETSITGTRKMNNFGKLAFLAMIGIVVNGLIQITLLKVWPTANPVVVEDDLNTVIGTITAITSFNMIYIAQMVGLEDDDR